MEWLIKGQIGSDELPIHTHSLVVENKFNWLTITVSVTDSKWLGLMLFDSNGILRAQYLSGKRSNQIVLATTNESTSLLTVPGELPTGTWTLEIATSFPVKTKQKRIGYEIEICAGVGELSAINENGESAWTEIKDGALQFSRYPWDRKIESKKRWYKGDFHTHTTLSDGLMTTLDNNQQAKKMGLDFFVATDHHVFSTGWPKGDVLVIPGVEITSTKGHFNIHGPKKWLNWRVTSEDGGMETEQGMNRILREAREAGGLRAINHPFLAPWDWQFLETKLSEFDFIELWNDPTFKGNQEATEKALIVWSCLWNEGYRVYGIGGSDSHLRPDESYQKGGPPSVIGDPATYVYSEELSANSILENVAKGHAYISRGPELSIQLRIGGNNVMFGDDVSPLVFEESELHVRLEVKSAYQNVFIYWIGGGETIEVERHQCGNVSNKKMNLPKKAFYWLRFEIRTEDGELLLVTNPIFYGERNPTITTWAQLIQKAGLLVDRN